ARDYPIVFSMSDPIVPVAIVGLKPDRNLFVGADGNWDKDVYIPAYIRRYPFILVENSEAGKLVLCCDDSADHFKPATGAAPSASLFEDGKPTALANRIMTFCTEFQQHYQAAIALCRLLSEYELLVSRRADVALNNGEKLALEGFQMVDEDRLRSLRDEKFLELRHKGVLPLIYTHLASATNWRHLVNRLPTGERTLN
ncbi:MAG TPA: SapC family protein, partial [Alphaproteobacteria bacterium]|nr:SapC family protein [Alphaproteobacteria bacterium]